MNRISSSYYLGLTFLSLLMMPAACGQRYEVGVLAGATTPAAQIAVGSLANVSGGASAAVQVSFAFRVVGDERSSLYVELPVSRVAKASLSVNEQGGGASASQAFFTPGVRWNFLPSKRVLPYLVGGAGLGWFDSVDVRVEPALHANLSNGFKPVVACGGGLAFRLARFLTLRMEMRDYIAVGSFAGNRNHLAYSGGVGFVF